MSRPGTVIRTGPGFVSVLARLRGIDRATVTVGLQGTAAPGPDTGRDLVMIGAVLEYGTESIPPRPWLRTSAARYGRDWGRAWRSVVRAALDAESVVGPLRLVALGMQGDVQATIVDGPWFPNSPKTIRRKGSDRPLIDSGQMRQSVRAQVERPGLAPVVVA